MANLLHLCGMSETAFIHHPPKNISKFVVLCDHATNFVPNWVHNGSLGIAKNDMQRHIAYDIGALAVSQILAESLDAHLLATQFSRLVIDPNRGEDDPTLIMKIYDKTIIPANRALTPKEKAQRLDKLHRPYHNAIEDVLRDIKNAGLEPIIISMHSFTKQLRGRCERPWHIGVLSNDDRRLADPIIDHFQALKGVCVGDNEPYNGALEGDTLDIHGVRDGILHVLLEIRNDLIETIEGQSKWAKITSDVLFQTFKEKGLWP